MSSSPPSPCCGKRPRTPPTSSDDKGNLHLNVPVAEAALTSAIAVTNRASAGGINNNHSPVDSAQSIDYKQQQKNSALQRPQQPGLLFSTTSVSESPQDIESTDSTTSRSGATSSGSITSNGVQRETDTETEPRHKMQRNSPPLVFEETECAVLLDIEADNDDDEELRNINNNKNSGIEEGQANKDATASEDSDSKPPFLANTNANTPAPCQTTAAAEAPQQKTPLLPLAPSLPEFMKPGATSRFRPRPEWYQATPTGTTTATTATTASGCRSQRYRQQRRSNSSTPIPPPRRGDYLPPGLMVAPVQQPMASLLGDDSRSSSESLLPEHLLEDDASGSPPPQSSAPLCLFGKDCDPALHVTTRENATEAALALLEWGAPLEAVNIKGVTPLMLASQKGNVRLVQEFLKRGAIPSHAAANGTTAVLQASHFGKLECLEILLDSSSSSSSGQQQQQQKRGPLVEMANFNDTTPLMRAAQEGHVRVVKLLLDRGAAVNRRNRVQMTALMLASQRGHAAVCQVLIERGAELNSMTEQNSTSLLLACKRGHVDVVKTLITAGCDLWIKDSRGRCAREVAQRREIKPLLPLLDANVQLDLIQRQQRKQRNYDMILLWTLLQRERAMIPVHSDEDDSCPRQLTVHQLADKLKPQRVLLSMHEQVLPPTLPYHLSQRSTQALLRTMTLPADLVEMISKFIPMPLMWERRLVMLTRRSVNNPDATVACALDLIDEVLEEGGFVEACDFANVTPPTHFHSWRDWIVFCRLKCRRGGTVVLPSDHPRSRPLATTATVPAPSGSPPAAVEMRRQVGFLQILANRSPLLVPVLTNAPYLMPRPLIQQVSDFCGYKCRISPSRE